MAAARNLRRRRSAQAGASTITQQLARMFFLSDEFNAELQSGERGRSLASYVRKARESLMSLVLETPRVEAGDPRAVPERRLPGPARLVCHPRRGRGGAHLLRQGRRQHQRGRGGADRRHHPEPGVAVAVRQPEARRRAPERGAERDAGGGLHHAIRARPGRARAAAGRGARRGQRSALFRGLGQPGGGQGVRRHDRDGQSRRRLHHAGSEPAARRARTPCAPAWRRSTRRCPSGAARSRPGRRRRWSPSTRAPARSWRWWAGAPTTSRSSTAPPRRAASRDRCSSRSSTWPPSSTRRAPASPT